ncbi:MAG: DUF523 domain-containing protein [Tindallia sp. MSAO_Bac2]|nr:MAG: DUF523 domain-containing protein [Tindallia sp. MSAO_Bac2]
MVAVSSCLMGIPCRYNGKHYYRKSLMKKLNNTDILAICPEQLGGLPTPRNPAEIVMGSARQVLDGKCMIIDNLGNNVTKEYISGAYRTLALLKTHGIKTAFLKDGSPSCGTTYVYDGTFNVKRVNGSGVTATLLAASGINLYNELDVQAIFNEIKGEGKYE